ncbi:SDR family NAD(P)-dependent oxidoreductase [Kitasatospora sp. NBC_00374]|uniref:SDR family NAD(P)-dependent oxidoreductase n=1 Tax=Kitasatospora sp. NBC_00374 TaxID=2975964 RepID=UPI0032447A67
MTFSEHRVALVSGGNRGLGLAIATRLAEQGMQVGMGVRDALAGRDTQAALSRRGLVVHSHVLDVTDPASVALAVADVAAPLGRLDVLIDNAAVAIDRRQPAAAPTSRGSAPPSTPTSSAPRGSAPPRSPRCARTATAGSLPHDRSPVELDSRSLLDAAEQPLDRVDTKVHIPSTGC